jgi:uncharacterized membrane protein YkvI
LWQTSGLENEPVGAHIRRMSLHDIFDYVWNAQIPWLWIFGAIGAIWLVVFVVGAIIARDIRKESRPK